MYDDNFEKRYLLMISRIRGDSNVVCERERVSPKFLVTNSQFEITHSLSRFMICNNTLSLSLMIRGLP